MHFFLYRFHMVTLRMQRWARSALFLDILRKDSLCMWRVGAESLIPHAESWCGDPFPHAEKRLHTSSLHAEKGVRINSLHAEKRLCTNSLHVEIGLHINSPRAERTRAEDVQD